MKTRLIILAILAAPIMVSAQQAKLFLVMGQSNSVGEGDSAFSPKPSDYPLFEFRYTSNGLKPLCDPVGEPVLLFESANTGSAWPAFGKKWFELTGDSVIMIACGRGGSSFYAARDAGIRWDSGGLLFRNAVTKTQAALAALNKKLHGVIWMQGEADASFINKKVYTGKHYEADLSDMIINLRKKIGDVPFYIVQTGLHSQEPSFGYYSIQKAQENVCTNIPRTHLVYWFAKHFSNYDLMKDGVHYTQEGYNLIGEGAAEAIYSIEHNLPFVANPEELTIFPVPARRYLNIQVSNVRLQSAADVSIFNTTGTRFLNLSAGLMLKTNSNILLDLQGIPAGFYILKVQLGDHVLLKHFSIAD